MILKEESIKLLQKLRDKGDFDSKILDKIYCTKKISLVIRLLRSQVLVDPVNTDTIWGFIRKKFWVIEDEIFSKREIKFLLKLFEKKGLITTAELKKRGFVRYDIDKGSNFLEEKNIIISIKVNKEVIFVFHPSLQKRLFG